ncbi:hypothetical protein FACS1894167_00060 [Synergistales bacterium]|nr:hypothetical protein FACS1894167_00060 [Synergistales bacterium]GHV54638.1 hypothetical protein FACS1894216_15080 [Synergistales bacterium]
MSRGYYGEYKPVAQKKADAQRQLAKLRKVNPNISPVIIEGRKIAETWWGIAWNKNLESYADYANRIGRGSAYVKNGMVLDLQIEPGKISSLVQGSSKTPYSVSITIDKLSAARWNAIVERCSRRIDGISALVEGKFPEELSQIFLQQDKGLFPSPKEISFDCSCLDWADMCKHAAASLYGVGARLDSDPKLFFTLRGIDFSALIKKSVEEKIYNMLKNADKKSKRVLEGADIAGLFGIGDMP